MRRLSMLSVLALMALILAACPGDTTSPGTGGGTAVTPAAPVTEPTEPAGGEIVETPEASAETPEAAEETPEAAEETPEAVEETPEAGEETPEAAEETPEATAEMTETATVTATEEMTDTGSVDTSTAGMATVNISQGASGPYLSDAEGYTLYTFTGEDESTVDSTLWEAVEAGEADTVGEGLDDSLLGVVEEDGIRHLTYNDYHLYRYTGDMAAGDMLGQGLDDSWYTLSDLGEPIQE